MQLANLKLFKFLLVLTFLVFASIFGDPVIAQVKCSDIGTDSLTKAFDPNPDKSYGQNAFEHHIDILAQDLTGVLEQFKDASATDLATALFKKDLRYRLFFLQSLFSVYATHTSNPKFESLAKQFRDLEDIIGDTSLTFELEKQALKLELDPKLMNQLKKEKDLATKKLKAYLVKMKYSQLSTFEKLKTDLAKIEIDVWTKDKYRKADREAFLEGSIEKIEKLLKDLKKGEFDPNDLDSGFHSLRRKLRIVVTRIRSLDGVISYTEEVPVKEYAKYDTPAYRQNKYVIISPVYAKDKHLIEIPRSLLYGLAELVFRMGEAKDQNEAIEFLSEKLVKLGLAKNPEEAKARVIEGLKAKGEKILPFEEQFELTVQELNRTKVLPRLVDVLKSQL